MNLTALERMAKTEVAALRQELPREMARRAARRM